MTLADWIVIAAVALVAGLAFWLSHRRKKSGKSPSCCSGCTGDCAACRGQADEKSGGGS
ncbi:MAG: FeoB-associated Cys-rich membrane protein [Clostridia bacterium]|nr:FeoB-associated Cys-rich membrane protein [Clostridia bacterium]